MIGGVKSYIANFHLSLTLIKIIKEKLNEDPYLLKVKEEIALKERPNFNLSSDEVLHF